MVLISARPCLVLPGECVETEVLRGALVNVGGRTSRCRTLSVGSTRVFHGVCGLRQAKVCDEARRESRNTALRRKTRDEGSSRYATVSPSRSPPNQAHSRICLLLEVFRRYPALIFSRSPPTTVIPETLGSASSSRRLVGFFSLYETRRTGRCKNTEKKSGRGASNSSSSMTRNDHAPNQLGWESLPPPATSPQCGRRGVTWEKKIRPRRLNAGKGRRAAATTTAVALAGA